MSTSFTLPSATQSLINCPVTLGALAESLFVFAASQPDYIGTIKNSFNDIVVNSLRIESFFIYITVWFTIIVFAAILGALGIISGMAVFLIIAFGFIFLAACAIAYQSLTGKYISDQVKALGNNLNSQFTSNLGKSLDLAGQAYINVSAQAAIPCPAVQSTLTALALNNNNTALPNNLAAIVNNNTTCNQPDALKNPLIKKHKS